MTKELSIKQWKTVEALLNNRSVPEAAKAAGVGTRTVYRWREQPEFKQALRQAQQEKFASINQRSTLLTEAALTTMEDLLKNPNTSETIRFKTAKTILEGYYNNIQPSVLEERLSLLEEIINGNPKQEDLDFEETT